MRIAMIGQKGIGIGKAGGGIENHVDFLSRHLVSRGHEVTVYARKKYGKSIRTKSGVKVNYIPTVYRKNIEAIVHTFLSTFDAMMHDFEILHYHGVGPATLAWIPRIFKPSARVIVTFHSQDRLHKKWGLLARKYLHYGEWASCKYPNTTIAVSKVLYRYSRKLYNCNVTYIPNGVEVQKVHGTTKLKTFKLKPKKYLLSVSRLVEHKGQHYLIEAFQKAKQKHPKKFQDFKLVIAGGPAYTKKYEKRLMELAKDDPSIMLVGHQAGETLGQLYAGAYLFVHPSESEGLALVVLEAMSHGTAPLVSNIPENLESISDTGFSFKNKNVNDLTTKLIELVSNPAKVQKAASKVKKIVTTQYDWAAIAAKTEKVYKNALI